MLLYRLKRAILRVNQLGRNFSAHTSDPSFHLAASLIAKDFNYPRDDVITMLEDDDSILLDFKATMKADGIEVQFSNKKLSVLDEYTKNEHGDFLLHSPYRHRTLRFNDSVDLVQSYAMYDASSNTINLSKSTNIEYFSHTVGLSMAGEGANRDGLVGFGSAMSTRIIDCDAAG